MRLRRSMLITPGNRPERIAKAATLDADCVVLDLEDSIGPEQKPEARRLVADALRTIDFGRRERLVRTNAIGTAEHEADLTSLDLDRIDALFVPKVESGAALLGLANWLEGRRRGAASSTVLRLWRPSRRRAASSTRLRSRKRRSVRRLCSSARATTRPQPEAP
ncbi:MAG: aldolase/citrate lyase family protein [Ferruginibacter sp.]